MRLLPLLGLCSLTACATVAPTTRAGRPPRPRAEEPPPNCVALPKRTNRVTVFKHARIFDGTRISDDRQLVVVDGVIASVGPEKCVASGGALVDEVDAAGATILPGLIDAHVHAGDGDAAFEAALRFGVTTMLDMFGPPERIRQMRAMDAGGEATNMADLYGAGILATAPGGHGTEYGIPIPTVASPADAEAFVKARFDEGSDFLKIVLDTDPHPPMPTLDRATMAALTKAAHERGKVAVAHVGMKRDAEDAVLAGVDGLAHVWGDEEIDAPLADLIAKKKVFVIATLSMKEMHCGLATGKSLLDDIRIAPHLSEENKKHLARTYKWAKPEPGGSPEACMSKPYSTMRTLRAKTPILAGTDAPNGGTWFGASLHRELELLVESGLTPSEALTAATSAPAKAFGIADRGRIAEGLRADLLLVEGDPTTDILATRAIRAIYQKGAKVDRFRTH